MTNEEAERLARIEAHLEHYEKEITRNGTVASEGILTLSNKLDALDAKWDARFTALEDDQLLTDRAVRAIQNKGAGILAVLGVVFTITATAFSELFVQVKNAIFGV